PRALHSFPTRRSSDLKLGMRFILRNSFLKRNRISLDAVKDVTFSIKEGEVFGLVGESGSGKSTIARLIAGLYQASHGSVHFNNRSEEHTSELQSRENL